jgi:hypothetical protein
MLPDLTARNRWYVLDGHTPRPAASVAAWAQWFSHHAAEAMVAVDTVGGVTITTRFTGIDRALVQDGQPALFETLAADTVVVVSHGSTATWAEAVACHHAAVASVEGAIAPPHPDTTQTWPARAWSVLRRAWIVCTARFSSRPTKETPACQRES